MITLELARYSDCNRCEVNCSFSHSGEIGRSGARIKVRDWRIGVMLTLCTAYGVCEVMCPIGAIELL